MTDVTRLRKILLMVLLLLALAGIIAHVLVHNPFLDLDGDGVRELVFTNAVASVFGLIDLFLVTYLFTRKSTASWAYLLNGLLVIYGTVIMAHCGIEKMYTPQMPWHRYLLIPTAPNIVIAWADFFMGYALFRLWFTEVPKQTDKSALPA